MIQYGVGFTSDKPWPTSAVPYTPRYPEDLQNEDATRTAWVLWIISCPLENCHQLHIYTFFCGVSDVCRDISGVFLCQCSYNYIHIFPWPEMLITGILCIQRWSLMRMAPWIFGVPMPPRSTYRWSIIWRFSLEPGTSQKDAEKCIFTTVLGIYCSASFAGWPSCGTFYFSIFKMRVSIHIRKNEKPPKTTHTGGFTGAEAMDMPKILTEFCRDTPQTSELFLCIHLSHWSSGFFAGRSGVGNVLTAHRCPGVVDTKYLLPVVGLLHTKQKTIAAQLSSALASLNDFDSWGVSSLSNV